MTHPMPFADPDIVWTPLPGALPAVHAIVSPAQLVTLCRRVREEGGGLVSLWGEDGRGTALDGFRLCVVLETVDRLLVVEQALASDVPICPDLSQIFPSAARLQRATNDLVGLRTLGGDDRPWLRHAAWPVDVFPLRAGPVDQSLMSAPAEPYRFVRVEGDGVHEIAVGPVHAGVIEPGHFRFSVVGEKVLRLEERLGYAHKGIEKRFEGMPLVDGTRLAARVSGDSAAAFAWAYAMAAEALTDTRVPPRALALRALLLERERIANHLGDLGALGNDAGLAFGLAQFSRLKEDLLRVNAQTWGARYPMDAIVPGGVQADLPAQGREHLLDSMIRLERELRVLRDIYENHAGLQDRFMGAGRITPELAQRLGIVGLSARASGQSRDWRTAFRMPPYDARPVRPVVRTQGDVGARVAVRFDEIIGALQLCRELLAAMPSGAIIEPLGQVRANELAIGGVEGWRGPVLVGLRVASGGQVLRCHPHDPSWHNWPALEYAILDNIVPDFPLINKSFNLSYSGHDL
jgi:Ni,Fe-hydrogenase III large subunit/Ni,Fe-hydrogenase III component G